MQFTILSDENLPIRGDLDAPPEAKALVVIVHGFKGFKDWGFFPWLAGTLFDHHFAVCRFNMSRSGIEENPETFDRLDLFAEDTYSGQVADLKKVVSYCQQRVDAPVFLVGHSRGGGVSLLAAEGIENLSGIVTWSAISHTDRWDDATKSLWRRIGYLEVENARTKQMMRMSSRMLDDIEAHRERLDILKCATQIEQPILIIHGGRDESVPVDESAEIESYAGNASRVVIAKASHTYNAIHPLIHVPFELSMAAALTARFVSVYA
ncbi:MAG TPA: alpha/beta fold hydrolase [Thermoanaerobaculia bacterium]|jgi:pimeloyl-ACP methyl ester carboxylesterase|nr:alpha/beta fold hydrolase [Thermoanaerobaculia bacterium]